MAIAPITGEIPVNTALNERASFRYSRIMILYDKKIPVKYSSIINHKSLYNQLIIVYEI
jgi:hypothetical protein